MHRVGQPVQVAYTVHPQRRGLGILDVLISLMSIAVAGMIVVPAIGHWREASRRATCAYHLRHIGTAIAQYEETFHQFPTGAFAQPGPCFGIPSFPLAGPAFWASLLPYLDQGELYNKLNFDQPGSGEFGIGPAVNAKVIDGAWVPWYACPGSPLEPYGTMGNLRVQLPAYVGISGASSSPSGSFQETRIIDFSTSNSGPGIMSWGGMLLANQAVTRRDVTDGVDYVMIVGESSATVLDNQQRPVRIDGGADASGWLKGTGSSGVQATYKNSGTGKPTRAYNLSTINQSLGVGALDQQQTTYRETYPDRRLTSAHRRGVHSLFVSGRVRCLSRTLDDTTLRRLVTRDDGATFSPF